MDTSVEQHKKNIRDAIAEGEFARAAVSLNELIRLEPDNLDYLRAAADIHRQAGLDAQAGEHYLHLARKLIERGEHAQAHHAWQDSRKGHGDGEQTTRRELYRLCRSHRGSVDDALPFLGEEDRILFSLREQSPFQCLGDRAFDELLSRFRVERFADGERVAENGEPADRLFIVVTGGLRPVIEEDDGHRYEMAIVGPGGISGETPFITGIRQRTGDLYAVGSTCLYTLDYQFLEGFLERNPCFREALELQYRAHAPERQLGRTPFFRHCGPEERREIATQMEWVHLDAGETLFQVGERHALDLYVVVAGWLSVNTVVEGRERYLHTAKRGNVLGDLGLLENIRKTTVRSVSSAELLRWPEEAYRAHYLRSEWLRHMLADRLLRMEEKISDGGG